MKVKTLSFIQGLLFLTSKIRWKSLSKYLVFLCKIVKYIKENEKETRKNYCFYQMSKFVLQNLSGLTDMNNVQKLYWLKLMRKDVTTKVWNYIA